MKILTMSKLTIFDMLTSSIPGIPTATLKKPINPEYVSNINSPQWECDRARVTPIAGDFFWMKRILSKDWELVKMHQKRLLGTSYAEKSDRCRVDANKLSRGANSKWRHLFDNQTAIIISLGEYSMWGIGNVEAGRLISGLILVRSVPHNVTVLPGESV